MNSLVPAAHILVVDDHQEIRDLVAAFLVREGFRVTTLPDGTQIARELMQGQIDLIVLDLMLPVQDGLSLCKMIRKDHPNLPIVILSAKGDVVDRVLGLELGADDYVTKPFASQELIARIRSVLRRSRGAPDDQPPGANIVYRFLDWSFDIGKRDLTQGGKVVSPLSSTEFELMRVFVTHPRRVLSRQQLMDLTKGHGTALFDRTIDTQVSRLRRKLKDGGTGEDIIKTVWGGGYLFAPEVTRL
jgi:two-component system, OmpR family, response regulator